MSSHDCRVEAQIQLKEGVTRDQVKASMKGFLDYHNLDFEKLERKEELDLFADRTLFLSIRLHAMGGYQNDSLSDLEKSLESIAADDQHFHLYDDDTGADDERCTPYFIGDPRRAQLEYGIQAMQEWVKPIIGEAQYADLVGKIRALPMLERTVV